MPQVILQNKIQKDESTLISLISRDITSITIPNGTTKIGDGAFNKCVVLTNVTIPNSVTLIYFAAFRGCSSLTSITIPSSVTNVGESAFSGCTKLVSVTVLASSPPTLEPDAFYNTHTNLVIYVPAESVDTYKAASGWSYYAARIQAIPS